MPRGGWLREVRRWACCGLRRTGGPSPGFGAFSSSPYTVPLCWVWGPGIAVLWSCQRIDVCDSVRLLYLLTYFTLLLAKVVYLLATESSVVLLGMNSNTRDGVCSTQRQFSRK